MHFLQTQFLARNTFGKTLFIWNDIEGAIDIIRPSMIRTPEVRRATALLGLPADYRDVGIHCKILERRRHCHS